MPSIVVPCYEIILPSSWVVPRCSEGRSRHRNTATRCISNRRQQLAAAAADCCSPNHLYYVRLLGQRSSWPCRLSVRFGSPFSLASTPQNCKRGFFLYYSDMCPPSRGCPVLTPIDLSVSARHQETRILVRSRRFLRVSAAACVSRCVCQQRPCVA